MTGSSPTTATRRCASAWASPPPTSCCRRSARPTTPARAGARCRRTGATTRSTSSPSRAPPAASASRRWVAPRRRATSCDAPTSRLLGPWRRAHLRQPGRGGLQRGRVLGEPQHRLHAPPARALRRGRQRLRHLGPGQRPAPGAGGRAGPRLPGPAHRPARRHRLLRRPPDGPLHRRARPRRCRPRADPRRRGPAVLALGRRHPEQVPARPRAGRGGDPRPHRPDGARADRGGGADRRRRRRHPRRGRRGRGQGQRRGAGGGPTRSGHGAPHVTAMPSVPMPVEPPARRRRAGRHGRGHPADAARAAGGRRADPGVRRGRGRRPRGGAGPGRGQGRRVRHHPRAAARLRPGPLLQHPAVGGQHHRPGGRPGAAGTAAGARDPVLRLHLAGHDPDQERGGHHPLALERALIRARW